MARTTTYNPDLWNAIQQEAPYKTYQKTILGQVFVQVWNPFTNEPEMICLSGVAGKDSHSFVSVYDDMQDAFFKRMNQRFLTKGIIIPAKSLPEPEPTKPGLEQATDEELKKLVTGRFPPLRAALNSTNAEATIYRMLNLAREAECSEKVIKEIETRLSEVQGLAIQAFNQEPMKEEHNG